MSNYEDMHLFTAEIAEMSEKERLNKITESIIGVAIEVHRALGPGLLESAYESGITTQRAQR